MANELVSTETRQSDPRIETIYQAALLQHNGYQAVPKANMLSVIQNSLGEIDRLEQAAELDRNLTVSPTVAKRIGLIWVFSGPGTYDQPTKDDKYKDYPWARGMDRQRLNHAARLERKITEAIRGENFPSGSINTFRERVNTIRTEIARTGPQILYNGIPVENATVKDVLTRDGLIIPPQNVTVIEEPTVNTVDQVRTVKLPDNFNVDTQEVALISHAPHLMRILHMLNKYRPFPEGTKVRVFPLPTPQIGKEEYATTEILALLYYHFLSSTHDAAQYPYPYFLSTSK